MRATREVENSISIIATFPSSLLKIFANGSVWYIWKPREVPRIAKLESEAKSQKYMSVQLTNCQAGVILVESHKIHGRDQGVAACKTSRRAVLGGVDPNYQAIMRAEHKLLASQC